MTDAQKEALAEAIGVTLARITLVFFNIAVAALLVHDLVSWSWWELVRTGLAAVFVAIAVRTGVEEVL